MRQVKYLPLCLAMGVCPDEPRSFFMQQYRWCMGTSTLVLQKEFWQSDIPSIHKLCFFNGMLYYLATALVSTVLHSTVDFNISLLMGTKTALDVSSAYPIQGPSMLLF